jgi:hypothetical protein
MESEWFSETMVPTYKNVDGTVRKATFWIIM